MTKKKEPKVTFGELPLGAIFFFVWREGQGGGPGIVDGVKVDRTRWRKVSTWEIHAVDPYGEVRRGYGHEAKWTISGKESHEVLQVPVHVRKGEGKKAYVLMTDEQQRDLLAQLRAIQQYHWANYKIHENVDRDLAHRYWKLECLARNLQGLVESAPKED